MEKKKKASIKFTKTSPYIVSGLAEITDSHGRKHKIKPVTAFCRCGRSKNMPFCDGSHAGEGLCEEKQPDRRPNNRKEYRGREITVYFDLGVCAHARECVSNLPAVFDTGRRPWILPDNASVEEVIRTIEKCPSGALSYSCKGEYVDCFDQKEEIVTEKYGPMRVRGGIKLEDDAGSTPASKEHYTLCTCGRSKNKPFCDGSHRD